MVMVVFNPFIITDFLLQEGPYKSSFLRPSVSYLCSFTPICFYGLHCSSKRGLHEIQHLLMHQFCLIQLWDVYGQRAVLRTYQGHNKGVRDVCFDHDGHRFLSCSYDRYIKLWDTETGQCIRRFTNRRVPYTVRFHPDPSMQKEFLAGCSDKKIIQVCLSFTNHFPPSFWFVLISVEVGR